MSATRYSRRWCAAITSQLTLLTPSGLQGMVISISHPCGRFLFGTARNGFGDMRIRTGHRTNNLSLEVGRD